MSKTLQFSVFTNVRLANTRNPMKYTPAHNKNGKDVSARLSLSAYLNENRRGSSDDKSEVISLTAWGPAADILAWTLTPGKEFTVFCDLNVYKAPVYHTDAAGNSNIVQMEGVALERKAYGYTIRRFDLGNDAFKHISNEIQRGVRGPNFWVKGHQDAINFKAVLDQRMAVAKSGYRAERDGQRWGFAAVSNPNYQFSPYVGKSNTTAPAAAAATTVASGPAVTADAVAATFTGAQAATPANPAASFTMPQTSVPAGV